MTNIKKILLLIGLALALSLIFVLWGLSPSNYSYFISRRIPIVLAIIITGSAIGLSSLVFQTATNNRILTPSILGLDALYVLIQSMIIFFLGSSSILLGNNNLNFLLSLGVMTIFSSLLFKNLFKGENENIMVLLLVGIIMGTLFQSMTGFVQMLIDPNEFSHLQGKMFASFNNINTDILIIAISGILFIIIYSIKYFKIWDIMSLGRDEAINLGVEYEVEVKRIMIIVALLVSISTALVGPITFLGLLVANLSREFLKTYEHKYLLVASMTMGIIALLASQLIVERLLNFSTPISVLINFVGGIYFIYLLLKENIS